MQKDIKLYDEFKELGELGAELWEDAIPETTSMPPRVSLAGTRFSLLKDGETIDPADPLNLHFVIVGIKRPVSRDYYSREYGDEGQVPDCYSFDGVTPEETAPAPQSEKCLTCPKARFDAMVSKVSGKSVPACKVRKILAVKIVGIDGVWRFAIPPASIKKCWGNLYKNITEIAKRENEKHKANVISFLNIVVKASFSKADKRIGILQMEPAGYVTKTELDAVKLAAQDKQAIMEVLWGPQGEARMLQWQNGHPGFSAAPIRESKRAAIAEKSDAKKANTWDENTIDSLLGDL
jgi:hypothetical protein